MVSALKTLKNLFFSRALRESAGLNEALNNLKGAGSAGHEPCVKSNAFAQSRVDHGEDARWALRYANDPGLSLRRGHHVFFRDFSSDPPGRRSFGGRSLCENLHFLRAGEVALLQAGFRHRSNFAAAYVFEPDIESWKFRADPPGAKNVWPL
jgi:hypothetical protein